MKSERYSFRTIGWSATLFLCLGIGLVVSARISVAQSSPSQSYSSSQPESLLRAYLSRELGKRSRIEIERFYLKGGPSPESQSVAEIISVEPKPPFGVVHFELAWQEGDERRHAVGSALVKRYEPVVVAKSTIRSGELFNLTNCSLEERELTPYKVSGYFDKIESLKPFRARGYILPGTVISNLQTQVPFLVNAGESVELFRETPALKVSMRVKALESGRENQWIRVENAGSKKVVQARVVAQGEVSLH